MPGTQKINSPEQVNYLTYPNSSAYGNVGLIGANSTGTPNTQYDFYADAVTLRNSSDLSTYVKINTGIVTNNVSTAGSTANGRDQAGAFSASSWIHFYWIWNGVTLATLSSASAPPTGPTLPSGYTHWAYIGAVYFDSSSHLKLTRILGNKVFYAAYESALAAGSATSSTSVSCTAIVPPNARTIMLNCTVGFNANAGQSNIAILEFISGQAMYTQSIVAQVNAVQQYEPATMDMPIISQAIYYRWNTTTGTRALYIDVFGYSVPN